jgi:hypothetical protein
MVNMPSALHAVTRSAGTLETTEPLYPAATPVPANGAAAAGAEVAPDAAGAVVATGAVVAAGACVAVAAGPQAVSEKAAITSRTNILKAKLLVRISSNLLYGYYDFLSGTLFGRKDLLEHFRSNVPCTPPIIKYSNAFMTPRCGMAVNNHEVLQQP